MVDEPSTRVGRFATRLDHIERAFFAAGIDPSDAESRERFGEDHRRLRDLIARRERRGKWLATSASAVGIAIITALCVPLGTFLLRVLAAMSK